MYAGDAFGFGITALWIAVALWEIAWKALALWKAARRDQLTWYILLLILNTVGILPVALWKAARRDQLTWYILLLILNTVGILPVIYIFAVAPRHPKIGTPTQAGVSQR